MGEDPLGRDLLGVGEDEGGFKLLGAPVGSQEFERRVLHKRVWAIRQLFGAFPSLEDSHIEFTLLGSCFAFPKFAFSLHTTDTYANQEVR